MSIRWKLLALLLGLALLPLAVIGWFDHRALSDLGGTLAIQTRDALTAQLTRRLLEVVESEAAAMRDRGRLVALAVRQLSLDAEHRLAAPPPAGVTVFPARAFDPANPVAPGVRPSDHHHRRFAAGGTEPLPVSTEAMAVVVAPGAHPPAVAADATRLAALLPTARDLYAGHDDLIFWLNVSLDSGVHAVFPGHGGYPAGYDPRTRPWYQVTRESGEASWIRATEDPATGQILATYAAPLRDEAGQFAGVAAIDVQVSAVLGQAVDRASMATGVGASIVYPETRPDGRDGLRVYVEWDPDTATPSAPSAVRWLSDDGSEAFARVLTDMRGGGTGVHRLLFEGREVLFAYAPLDAVPNLLVVVVPYAEAVAAATSIGTVVEARTALQLERLGIALGVVVLTAAAAVALSARSVTRPIEELARAARQVAAGDVSTRVKIDRGDEIGELAASFNAMVPQLADRLHVRETLKLAKEVQQNLLPAAAPVVPGYDVAGRSRYCDETGGDYYDFIDLADLGDGYVAIAIGDVSGHGVAAALLMTTARALVRSRATQPDMLARGAVGRLMTDVNRQLAGDVHRGRFMSLLYVVLDARGRTLRWASAGHEPAVIYDPATGAFSEVDGGGIPLGIEAEWVFEEYETRLDRPGAVLLAGTDGIWECRCPAGRMFGRDAVQAVVQAHAGRSAAEICAAIDAAVEGHRQGRPAEDDMTMVVVKVGG